MPRASGPGRAESQRVLRFWLDDVGAEGWYTVNEAVDRRCALEFAGEMADALAERYAWWQTTPQGTLALLILLDQIPRNAFRDTAAAFQGDRHARAVAKAAIARGHDLKTPEPERQFFYLPLMHSESLTDQDHCVRLVLMRLPESGAENRRHAIRHRGVIRRFGRFPSRNRALGRFYTQGERAYRAAGGYMG